MSFGPGELDVFYKDRASDIPERAIVATRALADEPELDTESAFYWKVYNDLSGDRPVGMGLGSIPWATIDRYASRFELSIEEFEDLVFIIRSVDEAWLSHARAASDGNGPHQKTRRRSL